MPCLRGTAAGAASDRLGLPRPDQAFALSHFSNASRSAPHWTGRSDNKAAWGDGDKELQKKILVNSTKDYTVILRCSPQSGEPRRIGHRCSRPSFETPRKGAALR